MTEVWPGIVISGDVLGFERQHGRAPFLEFGVNRGFEFFVVRVIGCGVAWVECGKGLGDVLRDCFGNDRVDSEMWIAEGVHITSGAGHVRRHIHQSDSLRSLHSPGFANVELRVACIL